MSTLTRIWWNISENSNSFDRQVLMKVCGVKGKNPIQRNIKQSDEWKLFDAGKLFGDSLIFVTVTISSSERINQSNLGQLQTFATIFYTNQLPEQLLTSLTFLVSTQSRVKKTICFSVRSVCQSWYYHETFTLPRIMYIGCEMLKAAVPSWRRLHYIHII